ncbi:MAG: hypothetical protein HY565_05615 [Candidatus Kerfeldbacteria bacterium]|nr:hypothetical protein [Candidatus Kerfeldbacteria bacterium]
MKANELLELLAKQIETLQNHRNSPLRVAVNGIEGSGKTTFSVQLVDYLNSHGYKAVHVTIDGYHNPKTKRYEQGRDSAQGYYEDAYNEAAFVENVLVRSQQSKASYIPTIHDLETDQSVDEVTIPIQSNTILVVDGAYVFKPIYLPHWDYKIYLSVPYTIARTRGIMRDAAMLGGEAVAEDKYLKRYHAAAEIYESAVQPKLHADIIIDNSDFLQPRIFEDKSSHPVH